MDELKLTGNCLLGSRPLLSFDPVWQYINISICLILIFLLGHEWYSSLRIVKRTLYSCV